MMRWLSARSGSTVGLGPHGDEGVVLAGIGTKAGQGDFLGWCSLRMGLHFGGASLLCAGFNGFQDCKCCRMLSGLVSERDAL